MPRGIKFESSFQIALARRTISAFRELGRDLTPIFEGWGNILEGSTRARFDSGRGPDGVPWPVSKRAKADGGKTLVDKGNLERAVRYEVQPKRLLVGIDGVGESVKHAAAHQFGSHRLTVVVGHTRTIHQAFGVPFPEPKMVRVRPHARTTNLPARPFLGISGQDRADMIEAAREYARTISK